MHKWILFLLFFSFNSFTQELPDHLEGMLGRSQNYFEIYNQKTPAEIEDGKYDDSEFLLFAQIDQLQGLGVIFNRDEIKKIKIKMIELIVKSFEVEQLEAISRVCRSVPLNKKQAAVFFEAALEYKLGKIKEIKLPKYQ